MSRAFVDYYRDRGISPVHQDVSDRERHFTRRSSLYRSLGIAPRYVYGAKVLEFGPGSGHNSIHTASLEPARYVLVDANPTGIADTRALLAAAALGREHYEVVEALVEDYRCEEKFDLVLAEGLIPFQHDPVPFTRHIASFTARGGVLVVTCVDSASNVGEIGRRLLANRLAPRNLAHAERKERLLPVFTPHLATLAGMSRSPGDWIDDNILHPLTGKLFSIRDAVVALEADGFTAYGGSPNFVVDWRWYKDLHGEQRRFNERTIVAYLENIINLLDYRVTVPPHDVATGERILQATDRLYALMQADDRGESAAGDAAIRTVREVAYLTVPHSPTTAVSLEGLASALEAADGGRCGSFASHFGRGQQYVSFIA